MEEKNESLIMHKMLIVVADIAFRQSKGNYGVYYKMILRKRSAVIYLCRLMFLSVSIKFKNR